MDLLRILDLFVFHKGSMSFISEEGVALRIISTHVKKLKDTGNYKFSKFHIMLEGLLEGETSALFPFTRPISFLSKKIENILL